MIKKRQETWGTLKYDLAEHRFSYMAENSNAATPYSQNPVVLNLDLTMKCNMDCRHCVTMDFDQRQDLVVSDQTIKWINTSPFMVVVITGGEPLLPEYEKNLMKLLRQIRGKGLMIDTNGTIAPGESLVSLIKKTNTLVRVSWDSVRPQDEICLRKANKSEAYNLKLFHAKIDRIKRFRSSGIRVAVQSVVHKKNIDSLEGMPPVLSLHSITHWYLQRLIPSHDIGGSATYRIDDVRYNEVVTDLARKCEELGIQCISKKDRRHNSVFLLVGDGYLYTQGEKPRQKIPLGRIDGKIRYFDYVSSSDHCERYYG